MKELIKQSTLPPVKVDLKIPGRKDIGGPPSVLQSHLKRMHEDSSRLMERYVAF